MSNNNHCPRCHALLTEVDEAAGECTQCHEPITMKGEGDDDVQRSEETVS